MTKKKTRPMFVSERFHRVIYKWGIQNDQGLSANQITNNLAKKLENELNENKQKKKKKPFTW